MISVPSRSALPAICETAAPRIRPSGEERSPTSCSTARQRQKVSSAMPGGTRERMPAVLSGREKPSCSARCQTRTKSFLSGRKAAAAHRTERSPSRIRAQSSLPSWRRIALTSSWTETWPRKSLICGVNAISTRSPQWRSSSRAVWEKKMPSKLSRPSLARIRRCFPPPTSPALSRGTPQRHIDGRGLALPKGSSRSSERTLSISSSAGSQIRRSGWTSGVGAGLFSR